jgi:hypothetical protein
MKRLTAALIGPSLSQGCLLAVPTLPSRTLTTDTLTYLPSACMARFETCLAPVWCVFHIDGIWGLGNGRRAPPPAHCLTTAIFHKLMDVHTTQRRRQGTWSPHSLPA